MPPAIMSGFARGGRKKKEVKAETIIYAREKRSGDRMWRESPVGGRNNVICQPRIRRMPVAMIGWGVYIHMYITMYHLAAYITR